ncbi:hypothetical protein GCM10023258_03530 [Terrabacter aeriphilus]|uniref:Uncharacterized protein n=1 Tax=Terrabacter aeriphilus TaxID=515662 RepID=A0ABP9J2X9_9MICO
MHDGTRDHPHHACPSRPTGQGAGRYALLIEALGLVGSVLLLGSSPATYGDLLDGVSGGGVSEVQVSGALPDGSTGYATVSLAWTDQNRNRFAQVVQVSDPSVAVPGGSQRTEVVTRAVADELRALDPSVRVVVTGWPESSTTFAGWRLPSWLPGAALALWVAALVLLANGPQPWWATRWAWFWALFSPAGVVALPLFLLVSGPPPGVPETGHTGRRLTGGWSFLLVCFVGPAVGYLLLDR